MDLTDPPLVAFVIPAPKCRPAEQPILTGVDTRCLSFHARYRCQHSGECCRAPWDIEVEPRLAEALASGRVVPLRPTSPGLPFTASTALLPRTGSGECGFHNHDRCALQQAGTEALLPSACRHFPRVYLRDGRGSLVTLSHFCPTAAALLFDDSPVTVLDASPPLALDEPIEGLDAQDALPPLVRPGMLADLEGYAAWEAAAITTLVGAPQAESALTKIEAATEILRQWTPSSGPLAAAVTRAYHPPAPVSRPAPLSKGFEIVRELTGPHPLMQVPAGFDQAWAQLLGGRGGVLRGPVARYLAATAFGNWIAYRGQGLRSIAAWLRAGHDVLRVQLVNHLQAVSGSIGPAALIEPFRMADYIMVHTVDSLAFGRAAVSFER